MDGSHRQLTTQATDFWLAWDAIFVIVMLQIGIVNDLSVGPRWLVPSLELALLIPLSLSTERNKPEVITRGHLDGQEIEQLKK
jgi:hypothetical protein